MYAPGGYWYPEVGDVEVFPAGQQLHLFHLTLMNHDVVHHAVSDDGLAWRALPAALRTGNPGDCDDDQIWTMSVTECAGRYVMLYTALSSAEGGLVQRTALATSSDLIHWTKSPRNPVGEADPRWYEADVAASGRVSWRDPKPILVGDTYYATVCARERSGPLLRRGCVGLLASQDLRRWEPRPPLFAPRQLWDLECPQVFTIDGVYYLTAGTMEDLLQRYWTAPRFEGPYAVPADGGVLAPAGHYAGRVCHWQGLDLYFCWHQTRFDWPGIRNPVGKFVVAPLVLRRRADGSLGRHSFPGWRRYRLGELAPARPMAASLFQSRPAEIDEAWRVDAPVGTDVLATAEPATDVWLEGTLRLDAPLGGIAFRLDDEGGGYFVGVDTLTGEVELIKWLTAPAPLDGLPTFRRTLLQRGRLPTPYRRGEPLPFRLLVVGPAIECSLGAEVILATLSGERLAGRVGVWATSGVATATGVRWAPMTPPRHR